MHYFVFSRAKINLLPSKSLIIAQDLLNSSGSCVTNYTKIDRTWQTTRAEELAKATATAGQAGTAYTHTHLGSIGLSWRGEADYRPRLIALHHESQHSLIEGLSPLSPSLFLSVEVFPFLSVIHTVFSLLAINFTPYLVPRSLSLFDQFISSLCKQSLLSHTSSASLH